MKFTEIPYSRPDVPALLAAYDALTERVKNASSAAEQLAAFEEHEALSESFSTDVSYVYIRNTIDTTDPFYEAEQAFMDENCPLYEEKLDAFYRALYHSPFRPELEEQLGSLLFENIGISLKTFSPKNIALSQEESALVTEYAKLLASAQIPFQGETLNLSQLRKYEESLDRAVRKEAYQKEAAFFKEHEASFDRIFDRLVAVRTQMAQNLGYKNFVELGYYRMGRNGYDANMVATYRQAVLNEILPTVQKLKAKQAARNGLDALMWYDDTCYYPQGNPKPNVAGDALLEQGRKMYRDMGERTGEFIDCMIDNQCFDAMAKKGKSGGGYCTTLPKYKLPFIFANFNGTSGDVDVLTHEAGHAFQAYVAMRDPTIPAQELEQATLEACEVHSMSMEFFCYPYLELYYGADAPRAREMHLTDAVSFLPYGCIVDHFQHVVYEHPELGPEGRKRAWAELEKTYRPYLTFEGPMFGEGMWFMRQSHIYKNPFYYIDYCLAQTTALQFWALAQTDRADAWNRYLALVQKAGRRTFLQLVEEAGLKSPFAPGCLQGVAAEVERTLL